MNSFLEKFDLLFEFLQEYKNALIASFIFAAVIENSYQDSFFATKNVGFPLRLIIIGIGLFFFGILFSRIHAIQEIERIGSNKKQSLEERGIEDEMRKRIMSAKTGQPVTLKGWGIIDSEGNDTGKRFISKKDAESYMKKSKNK